MRVRRTYRRYESSFKAEAVALLNRSDRPLGQIARDLGVPTTTLEGWYNADMARRGRAKEKALPVGAPGAEAPAEKLARLEREVEALRKENETLKQDRAILKKAAAFFAKENE